MKWEIDNKILKVLILILLILVGCLIISNHVNKKAKEKAQIELRTEKLRGSSLEKLSEGYYRKLVADSLTKKELIKLSKEIIELKGREPVVVQKIKFIPKPKEKKIDTVKKEKDSIFIVDYYPSKENSFLKYTNRFSTKTQTGNSKFDLNSIDIDIVMTQRKDGMFEANIKTPKFITVQNVDIQSIPLIYNQPKKDNYGILVGINYGKNLNSNNSRQFLELDSFIRYKKIYLGGGINTRGDVKAGIKVEL